MSAPDPILLVIFLRGGCDGLNLVGPTADLNYIAERRQDIRVERDGDHPGLPLGNPLADVDFRLHFKAPKLKELYDAKQLAIVHACGLSNGTRSHFEAQDYIERGMPDGRNISSGWLARLALDNGSSGLAPIVSTGNNLPLSLLSCVNAIAVPNVRKMMFQGDAHYSQLREKLLRARYTGESPVAASGARTLQVLDVFAQRMPKDAQGKLVDYAPAAGAAYPGGDLGNALKTLAQLIKMDIGVQIATADFGGWDTHVGQGGRFAGQVDMLSSAISAFWSDMARYQDRLTVVVQSEFGRRLKSNESGGTDHGHGNAMLVLGGGVEGGRMYGRWPGLANEQLDNQVDLAVTTDYRQILSEIALKRFGHSHIDTLFPGFQLAPPLGILRA